MVLPLLGGCVRNDGDIGNLFGNWVITSISCNGDKVETTPDIMINFQGDFFSLGTVREEQVFLPDLVGKWSEDGSLFTLNADYNAGTVKEFPSALGFGTEKVVKLTVREKTHNNMEWSYTTPEGDGYIYRLKKLL